MTQPSSTPSLAAHLEILSPQVCGRHVREMLQQARIKAGLSQGQAAQALHWSQSKVLRQENGDTKVNHTDAMILATLYRMPAEQMGSLLARVTRSRQKDWWHPMRSKLGDGVASLLAHESSALLIHQFQMGILPALLHTEAYQRAAMHPNVRGENQLPTRGVTDPEETAALMEALRVGRQAIVTEPGPRSIRFMLDEAGLWTSVADVDTHIEQLDWLIELIERGQVEIVVVPFTAGAHCGLRGGTTIKVLGVPGPDPLGDLDMLQFRMRSRERVLLDTDRSRVREAMTDLTQIDSVALDRDASLAHITHARRRVAEGKGIGSLSRPVG